MKTLFVLGAGPGLGNAVAKNFAQHGFQVALMARNSKHLNRYQEDFTKAGIKVATQVIDASDQSSIKQAYAQAVKAHGQPDVLFYNVGMISPIKGQPTADQLVEHYRTDVVGAYTLIQAALNDPQFVAKPRSILVTGGGLAFHPSAKYLPLSIDKAALRTMVQALHPELAKRGIFLGIVNVVGGIGYSPKYMPEKIADQFWQLYQDQSGFEVTY